MLEQTSDPKAENKPGSLFYAYPKIGKFQEDEETSGNNNFWKKICAVACRILGSETFLIKTGNPEAPKKTQGWGSSSVTERLTNMSKALSLIPAL
jgi:hypothetical protein